MLELILLALFVGVLISVGSIIWLRTQVPHSSEAHSVLFSAGTVYPYNLATSLRAKFFFPWVPLPDFAGCGSFAAPALVLSRLGAYIALLAFIGLVFVGLAHA
jgi:hypothetical protein